MKRNMAFSLSDDVIEKIGNLAKIKKWKKTTLIEELVRSIEINENGKFFLKGINNE